jgi:chaperonin cofactor prefoldin
MKENEMVAEELGRLDTEADVFKLVGPVLMRQVPIIEIIIIC